MKEERKNRIYDRGTGEWFSVSEEEFAEYDRWRRTLRQKEQYSGRCCCPKEKWWICDGMCDDCEFRCGQKPLSLDEAITDDDGCESSLLDLLPGNDVDVEEVTADRDLVEKLLQLLREMELEGSMKTRTLSSGMMAKAKIAVTLARNAAVWMLAAWCPRARTRTSPPTWRVSTEQPTCWKAWAIRRA